MNIDEFIRSSARTFDTYLSSVYQAQLEGRTESPPGRVLLYPQIVLCTKTPDRYIVELIGYSRQFAPLTLKRHQANTLNSYLGQVDGLDSPPMLNVTGTNHMFENLSVLQVGSEDSLESRFPQISSLYLTRFAGTGAVGSGNLFHFDKSSNYTLIKNCLLINKRGVTVRVRHINLLLIIKRTETRVAYENYLSSYLSGNEVKVAVTAPAGKTEYLLTAASFANFYLLDRLHEVTLGEFLHQNEDILRTAFNASALIYEPYLQWQEGNPGPDQAINPDLLVQRPDGYWDICDLKLPLLNRGNITKGERRRRRFIDAVSEGVAQLAHYDEYFRYPKNRAWAYDRYGVTFDNPRKILIVGNYENVNQDEIIEASRMLKPFEILDYDSILQLYLVGKGITVNDTSSS
jgi:hypothetical protein